MVKWLYRRMRNLAASRPPDLVIGDHYCNRWWVIPRNKWFNIYLHQFLHDDDDRALHDHPWMNLSFLLRGSYREITKQGAKTYTAGAFRARFASTPHRLEIIGDQAWSLFITGPVVREWGFHCPQGWRRWQDFTDPEHYGKIGKGCDD